MAVYMIREGVAGDVKIGHSENVSQRKGALQGDASEKLRVIRLMEGGRPEEQALHRRFAAFRKHGEWFSLVPEMLLADLGLPEIDVDEVASRGARQTDRIFFPRWDRLTQNLIEIAGGKDSVAKCLGVAPWRISLFKEKHQFACLVLLARQGRADVDFDDAMTLHDLVNEEYRQWMERLEVKEKVDRNRTQEGFWINKNPLELIWWKSYGTEDVA